MNTHANKQTIYRDGNTTFTNLKQYKVEGRDTYYTATLDYKGYTQPCTVILNNRKVVAWQT